jgi:DHA1 family tetracycline resistance protein-like MFS transporter
VYGYFVLPESLDKKHRMTDFSWHHLNPFIQLQYILKNSFLKSLMIVGFFYFFAFAQLQGISSVFFKDVMKWDPGHIGFYFLVLGIGDMFTQGFLAGKLMPKFGAIKLVFAGFLITSLAYAINAVLPIFPYIFLAYIYILIYALGSGLFEPAFGGLVAGSAEPQEQGRVQGASQSVQSITRIIGPIFAAFLYEIHPSVSWISCVIFSLIGFFLLFHHKDEISKHMNVVMHH